MTGSIVQACLRIVLASLGVVTVVFVALRIAGDPVTIALPPGTPLDVREIYRKAWGLDGSLAEQYLHFLGRLARGDLGRSLAFDRPVTEVIAGYLGTTLRLVLGAITIAATYAYLNAVFFWISGHRQSDESEGGQSERRPEHVRYGEENRYRENSVDNGEYQKRHVRALAGAEAINQKPVQHGVEC
jgi:ABC-type dipeptide/oligopeptide/nickel transport system permease component